jgi:replicative DNA helicase
MGNTEPEKNLERIQQAVAYKGADRWVHFSEYQKNRSENANKGIKFTTGWTEFDALTEGIMTSELMVVSGMEGNGKSLFCRSLAARLVSQGIPVGFMSWEGNILDALKPFEKLQRKDAPLFVPLALEAGNPSWVVEECYRFKAKHDGRVVILDHLHYLVDMNMQQNFSLNIGAFLRTLVKDVCNGMNMTVILVAHQQNVDTKKTEPGIETVRDSSFLRQEPDLFITVHRQSDPTEEQNKNIQSKTYQSGYAMVKIDKARRSGTYRHRLTFQKQGSWLAPFDQGPEESLPF